MSKRQRAPAGTGMYIAGELEYACAEKATQGERVLQTYDDQLGMLNGTMESLMTLIRDGTVLHFMEDVRRQKRSLEREIELRSSISDFSFTSPKAPPLPRSEREAESTRRLPLRHTVDPFLSPPKASATLTPKPYRSVSESYVHTKPVELATSIVALSSARSDGSPSNGVPNPDSSIEAIQLNIRESMKRRLTMKASEVAGNSIANVSKSINIKTPSRSSLFMKLPAKTPILDGVSWKSAKGGSKSRKVAERLEAEIARDLNLSPVVVPKVISRKNLEELKQALRLKNGDKNTITNNKLRLSSVPALNPRTSTPNPLSESRGSQESNDQITQEEKNPTDSRSTIRLDIPTSASNKTPSFLIKHPQKSQDESHISPKVSPGRVSKSPHKSPTKISTNFTSPTKSSSLKSRKTELLKPEIKRHPHIKTTNRLLNTELKTDLPPSILTLKPLILPPREEFSNAARKSRHEIEVRLRGNLALESSSIPQLKRDMTEGSTPLKITRPPSYSYSSAKEYGPNKKVEDLLHAGRHVATSAVLKTTDGASRQHRPLKGNAVPLPEAARGKVHGFSRNTTRTPHRLANGQEPPKTPLHKRDQPTTAASTGSILPDFGSDDEVQKSDALQDWAKDKNLRAMIAEQQLVNPATIFGEIPEFDIDEVFDTYESRARARKSPMQWSTVERKKDEKRYARQMGYH